jgi:hypothetical protein
MEKQKTDHAPIVQRLIEIDPDRLIELGHRIKAAAMDSAFPGDTIIMPFTDALSLVYHPDKEFCKPNHKLGDQSPKLTDSLS